MEIKLYISRVWANFFVLKLNNLPCNIGKLCVELIDININKSYNFSLLEFLNLCFETIFVESQSFYLII